MSCDGLVKHFTLPHSCLISSVPNIDSRFRSYWIWINEQLDITPWRLFCSNSYGNNISFCLYKGVSNSTLKGCSASWEMLQQTFSLLEMVAGMQREMGALRIEVSTDYHGNNIIYPQLTVKMMFIIPCSVTDHSNLKWVRKSNHSYSHFGPALFRLSGPAASTYITDNFLWCFQVRVGYSAYFNEGLKSIVEIHSCQVNICYKTTFF